jgi:S-adenosylmethionine decarboxylase
VSEGFGPHLIVDLSECAGNLEDEEKITHFLVDLVGKIDMTPISEPQVFPYSGKVEADKGVTGGIIIAESHIYLHTFSTKKYVFLDIFSCKQFDVNVALELIKNTFVPGQESVTLVQRGLQFPRGEIQQGHWGP